MCRDAEGSPPRAATRAKVSELPVQFPTKFVLVINLKTAKARSPLGSTVAASPIGMTCVMSLASSDRNSPREES